jgi:predicted TPR repeat methyltransferase
MNRKDRRAAQKRGQSAAPLGSALLSSPTASLMATAARHFRAGQMAEAERACQEILRFDRDHFDALHTLGMIAIRTGRNAAAIESLERALALDDHSAECHHHLGLALAELDRLDAAIVQFKCAINCNPGFATAVFCLADALRQLGRLDDAAIHYRRAVALKPGFTACYYNLGAVLARQGKLDDAVAQYRQALNFEPNSVEILNDLATATERLGGLEDAVAILRRALSFSPDDAIANYNLGRVLFRLGHFDEAITYLEPATKVRPDFIEAYDNLGNAYKQRGRHLDALATFERALSIAPERAESQLNLCSALYEFDLSCKGAAAPHALRLLDRYPASPLLKRGLAGLIGVGSTDRLDLDYARAVFDDFSRSFNLTLGALRYSPRALADALAIDQSRGRVFDILDAGCGTGLCGSLFRPSARSLIGVDVSQGMLDRAGELAIYDHLACGDAVDFMSQMPGAFDLVVAADVFAYVGDVPRFLQAAWEALRVDGRLSVSTESLDQEGQSEGYVLSPSGRYKHSRNYLAQAFRDSGFVIDSMIGNDLRQESDRMIKGWIVVARKQR